jgi:hypothetical protein
MAVQAYLTTHRRGRMATQEDRSKLLATGTADGLLAFCDYLEDKGYAASSAVGPWKSAARQIFEAVEGDDYGSLDVRRLDLDEYLARFEIMERGNYKAESLRAYGSRFKRAMDAYLGFLENGRTPQLRQGPRGRRTDRAGRTPDGTLPPAHSAGRARAAVSPVADLVEYPFPLRSGTLAYVRLPRRLEKADAERLAAFVRTLVFDPPAELPAAGAETGAED